MVTKDMPPPPATKPKFSAGERRARQEDRLAALRLRMAIGRELDERGIADPAAVGTALGLPAAEAAKLLTRHQWREGDVALLTAAAARLGVPAKGPPRAVAAEEGDTGGQGGGGAAPRGGVLLDLGGRPMGSKVHH